MLHKQVHAYGFLCGKCTSGFFHISTTSSACLTCPDVSDTAVQFFFGSIYVCFTLAWFPLIRHVSKRVPCLDSLIPFCQIFALLSQMRLRWPNWVQVLGINFSSLNLNLNLTLYECLDKKLSFEATWALCAHASMHMSHTKGMACRNTLCTDWL